MTWGPQAYRVLKRRQLRGFVCAEVGDIVYDQRGYDYGLASDDTRFSGREHVSVTLKSDGDYPGFTIPKADLQPIPSPINKGPETAPKGGDE